jgi:acetyl esterase/lipase
MLLTAITLPADEAGLKAVEIKKDIVYTQMDGKELLLDAYLPEGCETPVPAVMVIHGGGFRSGSKDKPKFPEIAEYLAARGFACFSINYRLMDSARFEALKGEEKEQLRADAARKAFADTAAAIEWVRTNHAELNIDPDRIAALGGSAGAICALSAAVTNEVSNVQAAVLLWGTNEKLQERITSDTPPIAIIVGTEDGFFKRCEVLRDICMEKNVPHIFKPLAGAGHGPWRDLPAIENTKRWSYEFLKEHLQQ